MLKKVVFLGSVFFCLLLTGCATLLSNNAGSKPVSSEIAEPHNNFALSNDSNVVGHSYKVKIEKGMTLDRLAQRLDIGAQELKAANPGVHPRKLRIGQTLNIPAEYILPKKPSQKRNGIVINLAEMRLYFFDNQDNTVLTFPVAIGRKDWATPVGETYVYRKQADPTWYVPKSIRDAYFEKTGVEHPRKVEAGPNNPLGEYAIYLHLKGYLIHGTNNPASIGRRVSSGCIRMYNRDVEELFKYVKRGTPVKLVYEPNKAGWRDGKLFLESHQLPGDVKSKLNHEAESAKQAIMAVAAKHPDVQVNWNKVERVLKRHNGIPTVVGTIEGSKV